MLNKIRSTYFEGYPGPYLKVHGFCFEYNPKRPRGLNDVAGVPIANRYRGPSIIARRVVADPALLCFDVFRFH